MFLAMLHNARIAKPSYLHFILPYVAENALTQFGLTNGLVPIVVINVQKFSLISNSYSKVVFH